MYRLGAVLVFKGGRESLTRLALTAVAVAVGVVILLSVFSEFNAYQKTSDRQSWESTTGAPPLAVVGSTPGAELWNYSENIYDGRFIEQLDVAKLGPGAPVIPGMSVVPAPGQYYASAALAALLKSVPKDELSDRFSGTQVGLIGQAGLSYPSELAIIVGYTPSQLAHVSGTVEVTHVATAPQLQGTTNIYREAFGIGAIAVLFPLLILVNTATRLAAARREERYAAMRLVGATPHQINIMASVDAFIGSLAGVAFGSLVFLAVRPPLAHLSFSGVGFYSSYVAPVAWNYLAVIAGVPLIAAVSSLLSLRRVQISPLGVSRKSTPKPPGAWRLLPLGVGIFVLLSTAALVGTHPNTPATGLLLGFLLVMIGIAMSGSWIVMEANRFISNLAWTAPTLLASKRIADNPKVAYRAVSGLALAVFVGSAVSVVIPALNVAENPAGTRDGVLTNVLRVPYNETMASAGLPVATGLGLVHKVESYPGTIVVPIYANPQFEKYMLAQQSQGPGPIGANPNFNPPPDSVIGCASLKQIGVLGSCAPGVSAILFDSSQILGGDNPLYIYKSLPIASSSSQSTKLNIGALPLAGMLVKPANATALEQIRTYLTVYDEKAAQVPPAIGGDGNDQLSAWQAGVFEPETVGEVSAIRTNDSNNVGLVIQAIIALTLLTAGCSLAVGIGGSLVERKRPFTLLRVSGTSIRTLDAVVMLEAAIPLLVTSIVAAVVGLVIAVPVVSSLFKGFEAKGINYPIHADSGYFLAIGMGLVVALILVALTLPLLSYVTQPEDVRFE